MNLQGSTAVCPAKSRRLVLTLCPCTTKKTVHTQQVPYTFVVEGALALCNFSQVNCSRSVKSGWPLSVAIPGVEGGLETNTNPSRSAGTEGPSSLGVAKDPRPTDWGVWRTISSMAPWGPLGGPCDLTNFTLWSVGGIGDQRECIGPSARCWRKHPS